MAKRGLYYDLVRQQEKHGANEDSTPNTAESQSDDKSTKEQQRPHMAQG